MKPDEQHIKMKTFEAKQTRTGNTSFVGIPDPDTTVLRELWECGENGLYPSKPRHNLFGRDRSGTLERAMMRLEPFQ